MSGIKVETQIERDFYRMVKESPLAAAIGGSVYRAGTRPRNSKSEDAVVIFSAGLDGQIQDGVVVLNIFVPKRLFGQDTEPVKDISRIDVLEQLVRDWLSGQPGAPEYLFPERDRPTVKSMEDPETNESYIHTRIRFRRCAEQ